MAGENERWVALILLPEKHNPNEHGKRYPVVEEAFSETAEEIATRFGGGILWRFAGQKATGYWWERGVLYEDDMAVLETDFPNDRASRDWLKSYARDVLLPRFRQEAIYIKLVGPVEIMIVEARRK